MSENGPRRIYHVNEQIRGWLEQRSIPADRHEGGGDDEALLLYVGDEIVARFNAGTYITFLFDEHHSDPPIGLD